MKTLWPGLLVLAGCVAAQAQTTLVRYDFTDQTSASATLAASTVVSNISAGSFAVSDGSFTSTNFTTATPPNTPAVSDSGSWTGTSPTKYFSFTITPAAGYQVSITNIAFEYRQTGTGALNYQVDIGSNSALAAGSFSTDSAWHSVSSSITMSAISSNQTVKIFGFNGGSGSFGIDSVILAGSVTAIPEPSTTAAILGVATLVGAIIRRRRSPGAT